MYRKTYRNLTDIKPSFICTLPDFIIVGAMKCGTSSLYSYLTSHPQVIPASRKEIHFFDNNFDRGVTWYRKRFPTILRMASGEYVTGEASPYYLYHPHVARRIANTVPDAKLIILLRDPVDRAISHYWHMVNTGQENLPMEEAFKREEERLRGEKEKLHADEKYYSFEHQMFSYLDRGKYLNQISNFEKHFEQNRILIAKSERLFRKTQDVYNEVTDFLNVERHILSSTKTKNKGNYHQKVPQKLRQKLENYYSEQKKQIEKKLGIKYE